MRRPLRNLAGMVFGVTLVVLALALIAVPQTSEGVPQKINYQGSLADPVTGQPLPGDHDLTFRIFDDPTMGAELWSESQAATADSSGVFAVMLGAVDSIGIAFDGPRWLEVEVDGQVLAPRREMVSVPFALQAVNSHMLQGRDAGAFPDSSHRHHSLDAEGGGPADVVFVDYAGEVGIGTTNPGYGLHLRRDQNAQVGIAIENRDPGSASAERISFNDENGGVAGIITYDNDDPSTPNYMRIFNARAGGGISFGIGGGLDLMRLVPGKVGIRALSPQAYLHVRGNAAPAVSMPGGTEVVIEDDDSPVLNFLSSNTGTQSIFFGDPEDTDAGGIQYSHGGNSLSFNTAGAQRMWISGGGDVVVGVGTATAKLYVNESSGQASRAAVLGWSTSPTAQQTVGVEGIVESEHATQAGIGVSGVAAGETGNGKGVSGGTLGASGTGVYGWASHPTGRNFGVAGGTSSPNGYAGYFTGGRNYFQGNVGIGTETPAYPLVVTRPSLPDSGVAIYGASYSYSGKNCGGVWGSTYSIEQQVPSYGVRGSAMNYHGCGRGVIGEAYADSGVAVLAAAQSATGVNCGIYAYTNSPDGYAGRFGGGRNYFSGKVGIGALTWDPANLLHVSGSGTSSGGVVGYGEVVGHFRTDTAHTAISVDAKLGQDAIIYLAEDGQAVWDLRNDSDASDKFEMRYQGGTAQNKICVTVAADGNVGIGTTNPGYKLQVGAAGDGSQARANAWNLLSSREYKKNIEPLGPAQCQDILEKAASTDVVRYTFTNDPSGVEHIGVIAEESPSEIAAPDGKGVSLGDYAAFLLAAIKAQQVEIEELKAQVQELQAQVRDR
jgi:hypothetical protein